MAYISQQDQNNLYSGQQSVVGGGQSGVAGSGGSVAGSQASTASTAGRPGQWTNVQDILSANPGGGSMKTAIKSAAEKSLEAGRENVQNASQQSSQQMEGIGAQRYQGQNVFENPDYGAIRSGLTQNYQAQDFSDTFRTDPNRQMAFSYLQNQEDPMSGLLNFNRSLNMNQNQAYSPGSQALDQLILSGDTPFVQNFGSNTYGQYQSDVLDPMSQGLSAANTRSQDLASDIAGERNKWSQGLTGFLTGESQAADQAYQQMQAEAQIRKQALDEQLERERYAMGQVSGFSEADRGLVNLNDYYNYTPSQLSRGAAAEQNLGTERVGRFNELANLLAGTGGQSFGQINPVGEVNLGGWNFDKDKYAADIRAAKQRIIDNAPKKAPKIVRDYVDRGTYEGIGGGEMFEGLPVPQFNNPVPIPTF